MEIRDHPGWVKASRGSCPPGKPSPGPGKDVYNVSVTLGGIISSLLGGCGDPRPALSLPWVPSRGGHQHGDGEPGVGTGGGMQEEGCRMRPLHSQELSCAGSAGPVPKDAS